MALLPESVSAYRFEYVLGNGDGPTQVLSFDLMTSQTHTLDADITQYPIERGVQPADHFQPKAEPITLQCIIADWRLGDPAPLEDDPAPTRTHDALETLINIRRTGTLVRFVSPRRTVESCALAHLGFTFDRSNGNTLKLEIGLLQVVVVNTRTATLKKVAIPQAAPKVDEGAKASTPTKAPDSFAYGIFGPDGAAVPTPQSGNDPLANFFGASPP